MNFALGEIIVTSGVVDRMVNNKAFRDFVSKSFNRYIDCEWDELDVESDTEDLNKQERIFSVYISDNDEKIWIFTERDRSVTTILFPYEY